MEDSVLGIISDSRGAERVAYGVLSVELVV